MFISECVLVIIVEQCNNSCSARILTYAGGVFQIFFRTRIRRRMKGTNAVYLLLHFLQKIQGACQRHGVSGQGRVTFLFQPGIPIF